MDYSFNIFNKNFTRKETGNSLTNDNLAYLQENHINCFNDNLGQSSVDGWSNSSIMTSNSDSNHRSLMSVMPNQNYNHFGRSFVCTQNLPTFNSLITEIPPRYPFINIDLPASMEGNFNTGAWDQSEDTERWHNHLRHGIKKGSWTKEEDRILVEAHKVFGNKWANIALKLCGRTENAIKNRWNGTKRRIHQKRMKKSDKNENPPQNVILVRYIRQVTNENESPNTKETDCTKDDDHENAFDGEMDLSLDVTTQTTEPLASMSTTSCYVPGPVTTFSWDDYFTYICKSMDDIQMLMQGLD
ncbi:unnamed protein product [Brassica napus]|uniref:(rape) hypothetical protein n=1 Tax=Brassica napus TaxID=3708 RepID=A0A816UBV9_BRANA|nr:unnamed protein product [Brassica napus]